MSDNNSGTLFLAIWGAIVSSITLGWNLMRDVSQRGRLRVSCYIGQFAAPGVGVLPGECLVWSVVNIGKEPVVLTHVGGSLKNNEAFILQTHYNLPVTLKQGETFLDYSNDLTILTDKLISLWASDSLNKEYRISKKQVKLLKEKYKKSQATTAAPNS